MVFCFPTIESHGICSSGFYGQIREYIDKLTTDNKVEHFVICVA